MRLIDADALYMDIIRKFDYCDDFLEMLESAPTVQPERKKGKWIYDGQYHYRCSNCGEHIYGDADATPDINKFCWNCGADMRASKC